LLRGQSGGSGLSKSWQQGYFATMLIRWLRRQETPAQRWAFRQAMKIRGFNVTRGLPLYRALYGLRFWVRLGWRWTKAKLYYEPMLRSKAESVGDRLELFDDIPNILGDVAIRIGDRVRLEGDHTWSGAKGPRPSQLVIGHDSYLGYQVVISVGERVEIGSHVLISNRVILNAYDAHPTDPLARARNETPAPQSSGCIFVRDYAWIGTNAKIMKNVTIGKGAIVAAGAVVTRDVPDLSIAAGNPAGPWMVER
jgi:acetyltransferase-like isoleucine patch superfamily enzyme